MLLKNLIRNISKEKKNLIISGLSTNSKKVKKNYIFFAIKGKKFNGEKFIKEAVYKGASVVVCSESCQFRDKSILTIKTKKIRHILSEISSKFYKLKPKNIIAVTGTNGKTSVSDLFYQILRINNIRVASVGTLGIKYNDKIIKTNLTSPDTITLHKNLNYLKNKKINNVIIEASSHGLDQKRLHHIKFKGGIFTNFSRDHLDYHKTMKSYLNAKLILFKKILSKKSTIISNDKISTFKILNQIAKKKKLKILNINKTFEKIKNIDLKLIEDFKIRNLAMAIEAAKLCGLNKQKIFGSLKKLKDVNGRLELIKKYPNDVKVFIDYAHTPDALLEALESLKNNYGNNISLVFGCGGERDQTKRPIMANIANDKCKKIYITDDNPRNEKPQEIRKVLSKHISKSKSFNIGNRSLAIKKAILNADPQEIILIAGKGHEEQQVYKNKILKISDKKILTNINIKKKNKSIKDQNYLQNKLILNKILGKTISLNFSGISIDTRTIKKGNLFLAIKGKKIDGNKFANIALKKGAGCVILSKNLKKNNKKIITVKNSISLLNSFAKLKRKLSLAKVIAVTGSAGKTSLKNLIRDLLLNFGKTCSSSKSFNNHLGVPISLSNLSLDDKFGVFEVGMSRTGEIKNLSNLIEPHIGVITNIGEAHIENFKSIYEIAKAKSEIIESIVEGGTMVLNRDDKFFNYLSKKAKLYKLKTFTFGHHKKSDIQIKKITKKGNYSKIFINIDNKIIDLEIRDLNIYNVLASIAVLKILKIDIKKVKAKLKIFESPEGRGKKYSIIRYKKKFNLIDESYNANPLSVKNAINRLNLIKKEKFKKYLILGDMLELGPKSNKYHEQLSKVINKSDIDKVFIQGKKTIFTYKQLNKDKRGNILQDNEDIDISLREMISNNDHLMIKGSNATGLNDFSKKMIKGI
ncbi:UDP-N-acetylmuramoyl-L-alanyl-D-glutamate--2,6-diaminopimelate ligase [Pelagibacterales bacterium SAG-MED28]|nr:UDP-N-acetylmuramoyl-L-alanyl-D-glutamate--2,6-diaminopimelate ligase [Pelagibacterales bacterium SAG-MED28]